MLSARALRVLYKCSKEEGFKYIRGIRGDIEEDPQTKNLILSVEDTLTDKVEQHDLEMMVLSVKVEPHKDGQLQELLTPSNSSDGFLVKSQAQAGRCACARALLCWLRGVVWRHQRQCHQGKCRCGAECSNNAIIMRHFTDEQIKSQIEVILAETPPGNSPCLPLLLVRLSGGDNAGTSRLQYPLTV